MRNEMVNIWLDDLLNDTGKEKVEDLTAEEIKAEIEEVEGAISNERLWSHADSIHEENIATLCEYLKALEEMLVVKSLY